MAKKWLDCPWCMEDVHPEASFCPHCTQPLTPQSKIAFKNVLWGTLWTGLTIANPAMILLTGPALAWNAFKLIQCKANSMPRPQDDTE